MKRKVCQVKSAAKGWQDAIDFAEAKIIELNATVKTFKQAMDRGDPWPGSWPISQQSKNQTANSCHAN